MNGFSQRIGKAAFLALLTSISSAQFVVDSSAPAHLGSTENVDFADVDRDGDWDAAFAEGAEVGNFQNRLWTNQGGAQGGTLGSFLDTTATSFPAVADASRDVEFVDFDSDMDVDLYVANTAQIQNQGSRFWTNQGGLQGGSPGIYTDETSSRWIGLGGPGSSISPFLILPNQSFIDWSCDADFADLDNDGDLDLFHSSYGGAFGGQVPSRIFLNDGGGYFSEFNPSGFQLAGTNLSDGDPGIWAEGTQQQNTSVVDGSKCDVNTNGLDLELMDIDGDFDIDLLLGGRDDPPRLFVNRLEEAGQLGFRDLTNELFPPAWATGGGNYEQEFGDLDLDGDVDIFGLNWNGFGDKLLFNDGTGHFDVQKLVPASHADDNEGDFLDFDSDGDLDLYVANWSGSNKLYRNDFVETGSVDLVLVQDDFVAETTLDADAADVDGDGDPDLIDAQAFFTKNDLLINTTDVPDQHAPYFSGVEGTPSGAAEGVGEVVRAAVNDNAPYYINWYLDVELELSIDGIDVPALPMQSSAAQIYRGVIPGNLVGDVEYRVRAADEYGNAATSGSAAYTNTGNTGVESGASSNSSLGVKPRLRALSEALAGHPVYLAADGVAPGTPGLILVGTAPVPALALGDGVLLNVFPLLGTPIALVAGDAGVSVLVGQTQPGIAGAQLYLQYLGLDGAGANAWASSNRLRLDF